MKCYMLKMYMYNLYGANARHIPHMSQDLFQSIYMHTYYMHAFIYGWLEFNDGKLSRSFLINVLQIFFSPLATQTSSWTWLLVEEHVKNLSIIHIQSYSFLHAFRFNRTNKIVIFNYHATFNVYLSASRNGFIETNCMFAIFIIEGDNIKYKWKLKKESYTKSNNGEGGFLWA